MFAPILRLLAPASVGQLAGISACGVHADPFALERELWPAADRELDQSRAEFAQIWQTVEERLGDGRTRYPVQFRADRAVARLVYVACRRERPITVLETGVADGISTFVILKALEANGLGTLHSLDVRDDVGGLVDGQERSRWRLHVLHRATRSAVRRALSEVPRGEMFFHDSNHTYHWQMTELEAAISWLLPGGLVLADDVDSSLAFFHWCRRQKLAPAFCLASTRVFGATRV